MTEALSEFQPRFQNWIRWCQMKGLYQSRTGSAEGNYRSPQVWDDRLPKPEWLLRLNEPDAIVVNRAYVALRVIAPSQARAIKVCYFKPFWKPSWQAQSLQCNVRELAERAYLAKRALSNVLTSIESKSISLSNVLSSHGETLIAA